LQAGYPAIMDEPDQTGFALSYARGKGEFRVYITFAAAGMFLAFWILRGSEVALLLAVLAAGTGFYFYPLIEAGRTRIGAGEHGIFIEGFGLIPWRSVEDISLMTYAVRSLEVSELHIKLSRSLPGALAADWRSLPWHRLLMKLPWVMKSDGIVRINLEPFPGKPAEIERVFRQQRRYFGGAR